MNYNIEWLFEEVYEIKKDIHRSAPYFISDWDVVGEEVAGFKALLKEIFSTASEHSLKYNYAYEQFDLKEQIIIHSHEKGVIIEDSELAITPSATISLYLVAQVMETLNTKRILVITPAYFSTHESLSKAKLSVYYYHLRDGNSLQIDYNQVEHIIKEQFIDGIILTDPVYSAGVEFSLNDYHRLRSICNQYDIYFIVDYSLGGLQWSLSPSYILNHEKVSILKTCQKFVFIDTLSKRLLLNGIKFSVIIGDKNVIDKIDLISETVYGGLSALQCFLIKELYKTSNEKVISALCEKNITKTIESYNLIKSALIGTDFTIAETNSGYFSLVNHNNYSLEDVDTKTFSLTTLKENNILCLTKDRFTYFGENSFGFRINLNKSRDLLLPLRQCIGIDYSRFKKR